MSNPSFTEAEHFLTLLFREKDNVTLFLKGPGDNKTAKITGIFTETLSTLLSTQLPDILRDQKTQVYFGALPRKYKLEEWKKGTEEQIAQGHVAWVDIDFKDNPDKTEDDILSYLLAYRCPPSVTVHSGGGCHAYWLLDKRYDSQEIKRVNNGLIRELTSVLHIDSCQSTDHVLRLPGSWNLKAIDPEACTVADIFSKGKRCTVQECYPKRTYKVAELPRVEESQPQQPGVKKLDTQRKQAKSDKRVATPPLSDHLNP